MLLVVVGFSTSSCFGPRAFLDLTHLTYTPGPWKHLGDLTGAEISPVVTRHLQPTSGTYRYPPT